MSSTQAVLQLVEAVEKALPLTAEKLQRLLGVTLEKTSSTGKHRFERRGPMTFSGLVITQVLFAPAGRGTEAELSMQLDKNDVAEHIIAQRLPKGYWLPPPPPGYGGVPEPCGAYVAERHWGQVWFAFTAAGLSSISFAVGRHGSPGI